jgi:predicted nuclease with TOPRIM domain
MEPVAPKHNPATAKFRERRRTYRELRERMAALELENSRLERELTSWHSLEASVQQLDEHFNAFQRSYACDVDKLAGLLLEIQSTLAQRPKSSPLHRLKSILGRKKNTTNTKDVP